MNRGRPKTFNDDEALERAMHVFWKFGYEGTSLDDLLSAMRIPRQSLYRTFGDKRALFLKSLERYGSRTSEAISGILEADGVAIDKIDALFKFWNGNLIAAGGDGCMMQNTCSQTSLNDKEVNALVQGPQKRITAALKKTLDQGQREGDVNSAIDTAAVARTITSAMNGLFGLSRVGLSASFRNDVVKTLKTLIHAN